MRLHIIRALASLAFLSVTTAAAPSSVDTTAAEPDLFSREVACVPSAEEVTCWNDGYGLVPVGSFSFIMAVALGSSPCQVQLLTQNFPYKGHLYPLTDGKTTECGRNLSSPPFPFSFRTQALVSPFVNGGNTDQSFQSRFEPPRGPLDYRI